MEPEDARPEAAAPDATPPTLRPWSRAWIEHHALPVSLGALALAALVVFVGVQVAPETFYDRFVWEDIYGPLVVDANQCRTSRDAACASLGPADVPAKDGYTITSELTYGVILAILLYGIYVGMFRRYKILADGWFVLGLLPWILLGPTGRVLEDANVFCRHGTDCDPGVFAYLFISPVIYLHIAAYVIPALLLGVFIRNRRHADPKLLTGIVGSVLALGVAAYAWVGTEYATGFSALPPLWFIALAALASGALFHSRARRGLASVNLTAFVLGVPFAAGCIWLIGVWLSGGVWSEAAWNGRMFLLAGAFILALASLVAATVYGLGRTLGRSRIVDAWGRIGARASLSLEKNLGIGGLVALGAAIILAGVVPALAGIAQLVPARDVVLPLLAVAGLALLAAYVFVHVGRDLTVRPTALLAYALGINVALVAAHMIDGLATWVALEDPVGFGIPQYGEKHPVSEFLLGYWDGFLFPFTKLMMVIIVVWMLDRETSKGADAETLDAKNMVGLVKMAIFVLGFAPGLRDVLRLTMGV